MNSKSENIIVIAKEVHPLTGKLEAVGVWRNMPTYTQESIRASVTKHAPLHRGALIGKLKELGASCVSGLRINKRREFYEFLQTLKS